MSERLDAAKKLIYAMDHCRCEAERECPELYPVGSIVTVQIGSGRIKAQVICHCWDVGWWMQVKELPSGRLRDVSIDDLRD